MKAADPALIAQLRAEGRAVKVADYTHSYPHCWRCDTPLIYWAKPTWFARTSNHRDDLLLENETVNWYPEHIKHGRFGNWLEGNVDWALSRDRFWGTPIPVWRCRSCGHDECVGSVDRLAELSGRDLTGLDLHRPYVDDIVVTCPECKGRAFRIEPVLDAWFDSGSMPAGQLHYPFERADEFPERFPADFICEAIDQTRGWFYSLLAVNTLVFHRAPYRNVVCLAHIIDQDGMKMSKSRGNVIDPWSVLSTRGAEALRWYMFSSGSPWTPKRVFLDAIDESTKLLRTLWNTLSFFVTYANLDGWEPAHAGRAITRPRPLDPVPAERHHRSGHRRARQLRRTRRRAGDRRARRRPLELVRAPQPAPLLEVGRSRGPRHAARMPRHDLVAARAVLPLPRRRAAPHLDSGKRSSRGATEERDRCGARRRAERASRCPWGRERSERGWKRVSTSS